MDDGRFDLVARAVGMRASRRTAAHLLAGAAFGGLVAISARSADAKKKRKKKLTLCHEGQTIAVSKKGKKTHLAHGDSLGPCQPATPPTSTTTTTTTTAPPPGPNPSCQGTASGGISAVRRFAQTFPSLRTGLLTAAQILIRNDYATNDFTVEIRTLDSAGKPTPTVLATTSHSNFPASSGDQTLLVVFEEPASVKYGSEYALVLTSGSDQKGFQVRTRPASACPGQLFFDTDATGNYSPAGGDMIFSVTIVV